MSKMKGTSKISQGGIEGQAATSLEGQANLKDFVKQLAKRKNGLMDFEKKLAKGENFEPKAVTEYTKVDFYNEFFNVRRYVDGNHSVFVATFDELDNDMDLSSRYVSYRYEVDGDLMEHRIGGPSSYCYEPCCEKIFNLKFHYLNQEMSEKEYWWKLASTPALYSKRIYDHDVIAKDDGQIIKIEFQSAWSVMIPSCYYYSSQSFIYRIEGRKTDRSTFYRCLEQRVSRIRV